MPKKQSSDNVIRRFKQILPCRLTPDEERERGTSLANARKAAEDFAVEASAARRKLKDRQDEIDYEISRLAKIVRERSELREVSVEVRLSDKPSIVKEVRTDTGDVVGTRKIRDEEAQTEMLDIPAPFAVDPEEFHKEA